MSNTTTIESTDNHARFTSKNKDRRLVVNGNVGHHCLILFKDHSGFLDMAEDINETVITIEGNVGDNTQIIISSSSINRDTVALIIKGNIGDNVCIKANSGKIQIDGTIGNNCIVQALEFGGNIILQHYPPANCIITSDLGIVTLNGVEIPNQSPPSLFTAMYNAFLAKVSNISPSVRERRREYTPIP